MKLTNLGYLLKEGIKGIFTHGFMSFAAVCVTVACLLIVGSFSILVYNVNIMVEELNQTNEILAYVDETLSEADAKRRLASQKSREELEDRADFVISNDDERPVLYERVKRCTESLRAIRDERYE